MEADQPGLVLKCSAVGGTAFGSVREDALVRQSRPRHAAKYSSTTFYSSTRTMTHCAPPLSSSRSTLPFPSSPAMGTSSPHRRPLPPDRPRKSWKEVYQRCASPTKISQHRPLNPSSRSRCARAARATPGSQRYSYIFDLLPAPRKTPMKLYGICRKVDRYGCTEMHRAYLNLGSIATSDMQELDNVAVRCVHVPRCCKTV